MTNNPWGQSQSNKPKPILLNIKRSDLPNYQQPKKMDPTEALIKFHDVLARAGLILRGLPEATGQIIRVPTQDDRRGKKSGWYVLHDGEFMGGAYGDFRTGDKGTPWSSINREAMTAAQTAEFQRQRQLAKRQREEEQRKVWAEAAKEAEQVWNSGQVVDSHPYLERKKVKATARISTSQDHYAGRLMVPAFDENGDISTIQFIDADGDKRFLKGGRKTGCYHITEGDTDTIFIAEGYATALTVSEATGKACVVAWDAGNLAKVGLSIKQKYKLSEIVIVADNDHEKALETSRNTGLEAAEKAASQINQNNSKLVSPPPIRGCTDFNDLHVLQSIEAVKNILEPYIHRPFEARPFKASDLNNIPRREFLLGHHLIRGFVSATIAPPGVGKSTLSMQEAISLATGIKLTSSEPKERCRVLLINLEDDIDELNRRVLGICKHFSIPPDELEGWLFLNSGRDSALKIAESGNGGKVSVRRDASELKETILKNKIDLVISDPFVRLHYVDENSNKEIDAVLEELTHIANEANCAIDLVHHTSKPPNGFNNSRGDANQARGASAFIGAVRSARTVSVMSKEEAKKLGVNEENLRWYVRVDNAKANMAPPASGALWYKKISIDIGNGDEENSSDNVGVLEPWEAPNENFMPLPTDQLNDIKSIVQRGLPNGDKYSSSPQATKRWLGLAIADVLGKDPVKDKAYLKRLIKDLLSNNILAEEEIKTSGRDKGKGLFVVDQDKEDENAEV